MRKGIDIVIEYCDSKVSSDIRELEECQYNSKQIKANEFYNDELNGCPSVYGLEEWDGLCFEEEVKGYKAQREQCTNCWLKALDEYFEK